MARRGVTRALVTAAAARRQRFAARFEAIDFLDATLEAIYHANRSRLRDEGPARKVLARLFTKGLKTVDAIRVLCESGYGEDAIVLARTLTNLVINLGYIWRDDPDERARDFVAASWVARRDYLKQFPQHDAATWGARVDWPAEERRAKRWNMGIAARAEHARLDDAYHGFFRFACSYDHSDIGSLETYVGPLDGETRQFLSDPSDALIGLALAATYEATAMLAQLFVGGFELDESERLAAIRDRWRSMMSAPTPDD